MIAVEGGRQRESMIKCGRTSIRVVALLALLCDQQTQTAAFAPSVTFGACSTIRRHHDESSSASALYGKKSKRKGKSAGGQQPPQEKKSVQDARFDAATRQFMFTLTGLSKTLPDKSKKILDNIHLSFYPGAKIGVVGLNGSGKSTLLKIMAGLDKEYDGTARPLPGISIGHLSQEPELPYDTVQECVDDAVKSSQAILDEFNEVSMKLADPDLTEEQTEQIMQKTEQLTNQIEASNLWELDRVVSRAMESLRVPPGDALTKTLSGGEKRRVALCRLLLSNHDLLLLDEPTYVRELTSYSTHETTGGFFLQFVSAMHKLTFSFTSFPHLPATTSMRRAFNGSRPSWISLLARSFASHMTDTFWYVSFCWVYQPQHVCFVFRSKPLKLHSIPYLLTLPNSLPLVGKCRQMDFGIGPRQGHPARG